uniref:Uncharacterized protein n=1 Tax=Plectus sambesii TaxID=2011161 RepID=A0A914UTQ8_9BILA
MIVSRVVRIPVGATLCANHSTTTTPSTGSLCTVLHSSTTAVVSFVMSANNWKTNETGDASESNPSNCGTCAPPTFDERKCCHANNCAIDALCKGESRKKVRCRTVCQL